MAAGLGAAISKSPLKGQQITPDADLIKQFQKIEEMTEEGKNIVFKVILAIIRDFKTRHTYAL